jgi:hypothetical protein
LEVLVLLFITLVSQNTEVLSLPEFLDLLTKILFVFTLTIHRYVYYQWAYGRKQAVEKTLVSNLYSIGEFIDKIITDGFIN